MNDQQISFGKLPDETWGVRIYGPRATEMAGEEVTVRTRSGEFKTVRLGSRVKIANGGSTAWYRKAEDVNAGNLPDLGDGPAARAPFSLDPESREAAAEQIVRTTSPRDDNMSDAASVAIGIDVPSLTDAQLSILAAAVIEELQMRGSR